jgi:PIN domain nuclease of toxin-antitoxin system
MRLLLDTHAFLWFLGDAPELSTQARGLIEDDTNEVLLSVASLWEMAIKISLQKLTLSGPLGQFIPEQLALNSIGLLPITLAHTVAVATLPFHHRDPFDRLLIRKRSSRPFLSSVVITAGMLTESNVSGNATVWNDLASAPQTLVATPNRRERSAFFRQRCRIRVPACRPQPRAHSG